MYGNDGWKFKIEYLSQNEETKSFFITVEGSSKEDAQKNIQALYHKNKFADYASDIKKPLNITVAERFVPGCQRNGISPEQSEKLFDIMAEFAKYAFNKSHSTAYAIIACKTAYYKHKYPDVFYAATLNYQDDPKKQKNILKEAFTSLKIEAPKMSTYSYRFQGVNGVLKYGLCGVKGFGNALTNLQIRPAKNLYEFCILNPEIPKDNMESLIKIGFFDEWGYTRQSLLSVLETCLTASSNAVTPTEEDTDFYLEQIHPTLHQQENFLSLQTNEDYFQSLQWENELLGIGMNVKPGIQILKSQKSKPYDGDNTWCNFLVLSCSEAKKNKNGKVYYEASLMDITGNVITRRFDEPLTGACMKLYVQAEDSKYFATKCAQQKPEFLSRTQYCVDVTKIPEAWKNGTAFISTPGNKHSVEVVFDDTGLAYYTTQTLFNKMQEVNWVYESDFKRLVAAANTFQ